MSIEIDDPLRLKLYACLRVWRIRHELTPLGEKIKAKGGQGTTWAEWFEAKFGGSLEEFVAFASDNDLRATVAAYERERFGWSPLERRAAA